MSEGAVDSWWPMEARSSAYRSRILPGCAADLEESDTGVTVTYPASNKLWMSRGAAIGHSGFMHANHTLYRGECETASELTAALLSDRAAAPINVGHKHAERTLPEARHDKLRSPKPIVGAQYRGR